MNMKQITISMVVVFLLGMNCFAQNEAKFRSLRENITKSDAAIQDAKKGINVKTWMDRGKLFQNAYNANIDALRAGMTTNEVKLFFKNPREVVSSEEEGKETYVYSKIRLNFEDDMLRSWEETQTVADDPLTEAINAYKKATSLDVKNKNAKKIDDAYRVITGDLETKFFNEYYLTRYKDAYNTALQRIEVSKLRGATDTLYYYLAGVVAMDQSSIDSSMWNLAINNLETALSFGPKETVQLYHLLFNSYMKINELDKALKYAQTGFEKNPNSEELMYDLINYYLSREENQQALDYLEQAVAKDPKNSNLLFAQGRVLYQLGETEKSIAAYDAAIAINPAYFEPHYNKAVVHYNEAIRLMDDANNERTNAGFEAKKKIADQEFMKAIPLMEKAHELRPAEPSTLETLRILYYRMQTEYPELESKYNDIVKKIEALQ